MITPTAPQVETKDAAPINVAFDKAEDAESLSRLRHKRTERDEEIQEAKKQLKDSDSAEDKKAMTARVAFLEKMKDALNTAITAAETREIEHD